ncbi:MAG: hypothetical protein WD042_17145 [Phycisphaeraceae bacterium]
MDDLIVVHTHVMNPHTGICDKPETLYYSRSTGMANNYKKGDLIPPHPVNPVDTCREVKACPSVWNAKCNNPVSPRDAGTLAWNCRDWPQATEPSIFE